MTAIEFSKVNKSYGKTKIFDELNMTVRCGEIFTLLGQSGCGKTTLVSSLVSKILVDSGEIAIFGEKLWPTKIQLFPLSMRQIGFMPQEDGLYPPLFKIAELFTFFGRLYQMDKREIDKRINELQNILQLPNMEQYVQDLSGGERRRVSVGLALIHRPRLVILDEPSVGVDPLVRASIWDNFRHLASTEGTTILLTTHYSEEARLADTIGYMADGKLLFQGSPLSLMAIYNTVLIQDCILELSRNKKVLQLENESNAPDILSDQSHSMETQTMEQYTNSRCKSKPLDFLWHEIYTVYLLIARNILWVGRQKGLVFFTIAELWMFVLLLGYVGRDPANLKFVVFNPELTNFPGNDSILETCKVLENQNSNKHWNDSSCLPGLLSCSFLLQLPPHKIILARVESEEEGVNAIKKGEAIGLLNFPANFSSYFTNRILLNKFAQEEIINGSQIGMRLDMTNKIIAGYLLEEIPRSFLNFVKELGKNCEFETHSAESPLKISAVYGSLETGIGEYLQPFAPLLLILTTTITSSLYYIFERRLGIVGRCRVAGVSSSSELLSRLLTDAVLGLSLYITVLPLLILWHGWGLDLSLIWYSIIVLSVAVVGSSVGFFLATIFDNEFAAVLCMLGFLSLNFISSGSIWPIITTHPIHQFFCNMLPLSIPLESGRLILFKGWSLIHPKVLPGLVCPIILTIILSVCSIVVSAIKRI